MSTAPWSPAAPGFLRQSIEHVHRFEAVTRSGTVHPLDVISASVSFDEGATPHVQMNIQARVPTDPALLDVLDPRTGVRIDCYAGYRYPNAGTDVHRLAGLWLHDRNVRRSADDNVMTLTAYSDELFSMEDVQTTTHRQPPRTGAAEALEWFIRRVYDSRPEAPTILNPNLGEGVGASLLAELVMEYGDTYAEHLTATADLVDGWVHCTGQPGEWVIRRRPTVGAAAVHAVSTGPTGNLTDLESVLSREEWANLVVLEHVWTPASGNGEQRVRRAAAAVTSGPMAVAAAGRKVRHIRRTTPASITAVQAAVQTLVKRTVSRGRGYGFTTPSAYWLRPAQSVLVTPPGGQPARHLVSRVQFSFPDGLMTARTRLPTNVDVTGE